MTLLSQPHLYKNLTLPEWSILELVIVSIARLLGGFAKPPSTVLQIQIKVNWSPIIESTEHPF